MSSLTNTRAPAPRHLFGSMDPLNLLLNLSIQSPPKVQYFPIEICETNGGTGLCRRAPWLMLCRGLIVLDQYWDQPLASTE